MSFDQIITKVDDFVWGWPLMICILAVGLLLTVCSGLIQVKHIGKAFRFMFRKDKEAQGDVSTFGALCTALSATIGTGNIVGVATAVCTGGPGALFWMVVAAFFGMATKFAECFLAVKYRKIEPDGTVLGGPFYYIEKGLGKNFRWLAVLFAVFGLCVGLMGIGTFTQVNGITSCVNTFFSGSPVAFSVGEHSYTWATVISGVLVAFFAALVIIGGLKRISRVAEVIVPFMAIAYVLISLLLLLLNLPKIPGAIAEIVRGAFQPAAITGGAVGSIFVAMQKGIARGIFSNEAGLGSAPIAAAAAQTKEPVRQGLVSMLGTFIDTIIICSMTGLSIVITGAWKVAEVEQGAATTVYAFQQGLPFPPAVSSFILMVCLAFFAFTTILGWNYYSEKCLQYLIGGKNKAVLMTYRVIYILAVFFGPYLTVAAVWNIADIFNGLMAFPNIIALILLCGVVRRDTKEYFKKDLR